jgi:type III secretion protein W
MRVDNAAAAASFAADHEASDADATLQAGSYRGQAVQLSKDIDVLGDAAEEISMEHSEHVESHKLEEREVEDAPEVDVPLIEQIQQYLESAGKGDLEEKLRQFVEALLQRDAHGAHGDGTGAREEARRRFDGPTEQFLALAYAADELARAPDKQALVDEVRAALRDLHDDFGGHIRADLNTIDVAAAFGEGEMGDAKAAAVARFQAGYRDAVHGGGDGLAGLLKATLGRFGEADYGRAVARMIQALGNDLNAIQGPSAPPARLNAVLQDLFQLEVLSTALDGCRTLARRLDEAHGVAVQPGAVLQDLVGAAGERWATGSRYTAIAERHGAKDTRARIMFLQNALTIVRNLPPKVFADGEARLAAVDAVRDALDAAIDEENEE